MRTRIRINQQTRLQNLVCSKFQRKRDKPDLPLAGGLFGQSAAKPAEGVYTLKKYAHIFVHFLGKGGSAFSLFGQKAPEKDASASTSSGEKKDGTGKNTDYFFLSKYS